MNWRLVFLAAGFLHGIFCIWLFLLGIIEILRFMDRTGATLVQWLIDFGVVTHESGDFSYAMVMYGASGIPLIFCELLLIFGSTKAYKLLKTCFVPCMLLSVAPTTLLAWVLCSNIGLIGLARTIATANFLLGSVVGYVMIGVIARNNTKTLLG